MNNTRPATPPAAEQLSMDRARELLAIYQAQWNSGDMSTFLKGFSDDVVVEFADLPKIEGKSELTDFIFARLARQQGYKLEKTLRAVAGSTIICSWVASWTDAKSNEPMRGRGTEFITIRDGKCSHWEAYFNGWSEDQPSISLFV